MIYPKFLKPGDTVGICAPSRGIDKEDITFDVSLNNLKKEGYNVFETQNVRTGKLPSTDAITRANEFNELVKREDISFIFSASGGDFMIEILPYINEELIKNNIKWVSGYSDPTSLLYYITTKFDIATVYGVNAGSFDQENLYKSLKDSLEIVKGNLVKQESFPMCERLSYEEKANQTSTDYVLNNEVKWQTLNGDVDIEGRLIGGCIDCLKSMIGTRFDYTKEFIDKYNDDGIIWYFDNFALKAEELYYTLWQMKEAGWFLNSKGFVFGRTKYEGSDGLLSYEEAVKRALGDEIPIILDADIGHVKPTFTLINGAIGHFKSKDGKGSLEMFLK